MKILVTGVNGQLGYDVVPQLLERGHEVIGSGTSDQGPVWSRAGGGNSTPAPENKGGQAIPAGRKPAPENKGDQAIPAGRKPAPENKGDQAIPAGGKPAPENKGDQAIPAGGKPAPENTEYQAGPAPREAYEYRRMDITVKEEVDRVMEQIRPDLVIHCAAWTAVDAAEEPENYDRVMAVNAEGTRYIAEACRRGGAAMLYISTDYVFDGQGTEPWKADCEDFAPLNIYGRSKLAGEQAVRELLERYFIVRIAWVFGIHGGNFIKTMLRLGETHPELRVVSDQIGTPTYTRDLAGLLADLAESDRYGIYHATNEGGYISWYDLAVEIFRRSGQNVRVAPVTTEEYGISKAVRPFNSRLDKSRLTEQGFRRLPDWKDALDRFLQEVGYGAARI